MGMIRRGLAAISAALLLASCTTAKLDPNDPGLVSGYLMVFWVGEDKFVYYPFYDDPLVFKLPRSMAQKLGSDVTTIRPGAIYTDGGSIPSAVRGWAGLSPWGYGPAYIVHDWLFVAHHCIVTDQVALHDKRDLAEVDKVRNVDFQMSADMLAAVIDALVRQNLVPKRDFAPGAIYTAVESGIARSLWDTTRRDSCRPVEPKIIADIEKKLRAKAFDRLTEDDGGPVLVFQRRF